jgi:hypothetical protein
MTRFFFTLFVSFPVHLHESPLRIRQTGGISAPSRSATSVVGIVASLYDTTNVHASFSARRISDLALHKLFRNSAEIHPKFRPSALSAFRKSRRMQRAVFLPASVGVVLNGITKHTLEAKRGKS